MLALLFLADFVQSQACDPGWSEYNNNCYKHFDTPNQRLIIPTIRSKCQSLGGDIAVGANTGERNFMDTLTRPTFNGDFTLRLGADVLIIGIAQDMFNNWTSVNPNDPIVDQLPWCKNQPDQRRCEEHCVLHMCFWSGTFCYHDHPCSGYDAPGFRRYICKKSKSAPTTPTTTSKTCADKNALVSGDKCICKTGYIDIRSSDAVDRQNYKEGEKCVPEDPCRSLRTSLSMIFIIDASQSIQSKNWPSLVNFLKSGASLIPDTVNVGFIKFATEVTFANWLPRNWTSREFERMVPTDYDAGYTNTPAAINKAVEMFKADGSREKVAVLITDGLPVIDGATDKEKGLSDTQDAVDKLRKNEIDLVALGFGPELQMFQGVSYIKKWLEDPNEDYFSFENEADDLRSVHMQILLQKVCRKYV